VFSGVITEKRVCSCARSRWGKWYTAIRNNLYNY